MDEPQVRRMWLEWKTWADSGTQIIFHFAPPCATFSRARDRSVRTRLRSTLHPEGIPPIKPRALEGNRIAASAALCIQFLVNECGAQGTLENPALSYLWPFLEQTQILAKLDVQETIFHQCRFGAPYKKPTRLWCFGGFSAASLGKVCVWAGSKFSCGRTAHATLEFGGLPTAPAAAYPDAYCAAHAAAVHKATLSLSARDRVEVITSGRVKRHADRGETAASAREVRDAEDAASFAGARNAAEVIARWPLYAEVMRPIREVLLAAVKSMTDLWHQVGALGKKPKRKPPTDVTIWLVRKRLAPVLGLSHQDADAHHPASPWRYNLVRAVTAATDDDPLIWMWLKDGAPYRERLASSTWRAFADHLRGPYLIAGGVGGRRSSRREPSVFRSGGGHRRRACRT